MTRTKSIILLTLLVSVIVVVSLGFVQKVLSANVQDTPCPNDAESYPTSSESPLKYQCGSTTGMILGAIAIVLIIFVGAGINYWSGDRGASDLFNP